MASNRAPVKANHQIRFDSLVEGAQDDISLRSRKSSGGSKRSSPRPQGGKEAARKSPVPRQRKSPSPVHHRISSSNTGSRRGARKKTLGQKNAIRPINSRGASDGQRPQSRGASDGQDEKPRRRKTPSPSHTHRNRQSRNRSPKRFLDAEQPATPRDLQFLEQSSRASDRPGAYSPRGFDDVGATEAQDPKPTNADINTHVATLKEVTELDLSVHEIEQLMAILVVKRRQKIQRHKHQPTTSEGAGDVEDRDSCQGQGGNLGEKPSLVSDAFLSDILRKQKTKLEELWCLHSLYSNSLANSRKDETSETYDPEVQHIQRNILGDIVQQEPRYNRHEGARAPHDKMFSSVFSRTLEGHTPASLAAGQCSQEPPREVAPKAAPSPPHASQSMHKHRGGRQSAPLLPHQASHSSSSRGKTDRVHSRRNSHSAHAHAKSSQRGRGKRHGTGSGALSAAAGVSSGNASLEHTADLPERESERRRRHSSGNAGLEHTADVVERDERTRRQHRRDYGASPGGLLFRRTPQPEVPPLNLDVITKETEPHAPPPIGDLQPSSDDPARFLYSPRAQHSPRVQSSLVRLSDRCASPDLAKHLGQILSPRSAFSKTSRSAGSTTARSAHSAFSTPSTTPRSDIASHIRGLKLTPRQAMTVAAHVAASRTRSHRHSRE